MVRIYIYQTGKENHFLYPAGVKKQIIVMYKDLFGIEIINTKKSTKKNVKTGKNDKVLTYSLDEKHYEQYHSIFALNGRVRKTL